MPLIGSPPQILTAERVRELFNYDPDTGLFTRRIAIGYRGRFRKGDVPGTDNKNGYIRIIVDYKKYYAHRLAWLHVFGYLPEEIDHIDRNRSNNRISNLRPATHAQNLSNALRLRTKSGLKGAYRFQNRWKSSITSTGKQIHLGLFDTAEEAHAAYVAAAKKYHGEFARY